MVAVFLEVIRESSGKGSHHMSSLSFSLVFQRRVALYVHQLLGYSLGSPIHFPSG